MQKGVRDSCLVVESHISLLENLAKSQHGASMENKSVKGVERIN